MLNTCGGSSNGSSIAPASASSAGVNLSSEKVLVLNDRKLKTFLQNISIVSVEISVGDILVIFKSEWGTEARVLSRMTFDNNEENIILSAAALI